MRCNRFSRPVTVTSVFAAAMMLVGCSHDAMLLESDVPVPTGMETVRSADIRRSEGTVSGGRFILAGPVEDAGSLMVATRERYRANGWKTVLLEDGLDHAEGIFEKGNRRARLTIDRRAIEPDMSSGSLEIGPLNAAGAGGDRSPAAAAGEARDG
jgi:hypothetical protein